MELTEYLRIARRWWWLLIAAPLIGGAVAYGVSTRITPTYEATATLLVVQRQTEGVVQLNDLQTSQQLANTFTRLITIRPVLQRAIDSGGLPFDVITLGKRISVGNPRSTQLLEVSARDRDPEMASRLANTVSEAFISSNQSDLTSRPGVVTIVERAEPPLAPVSPRKTLNAALGGMLALLAVSGLVLLLEYLDDTVKSPEQVAQLTGLTTIGRVEEFPRTKLPGGQLPAANSPRSTAAEAYRSTRTLLAHALELGNGRRQKAVLVTSPGTTEGKTTTVANLAVVFGLAGLRVCVVDGDLRRPSQHRVFGMDNAEGLSTLLTGRWAEIDDVVRRSSYTNVSLLAAGPSPVNPSELLGSPQMTALIEELRSRFDIVLIDSPPVLAVTDASVLATEADGVLIVARSGRTRTGALRAAIQELAASGRPIDGVLLNRVSARDATYYRHYYAPQEYSVSPEERLRRVRSTRHDQPGPTVVPVERNGAHEAPPQPASAPRDLPEGAVSEGAAPAGEGPPASATPGPYPPVAPEADRGAPASPPSHAGDPASAIGDDPSDAATHQLFGLDVPAADVPFLDLPDRDARTGRRRSGRRARPES